LFTIVNGQFARNARFLVACQCKILKKPESPVICVPTRVSGFTSKRIS
jgi:hypothetical protein